MRILALAALAAALALPAAAQQALYKWTDAQGRVHYGDKPPKGFTGPVQKIETEPLPTAPVLPSPSTPAAPAAPAPGAVADPKAQPAPPPPDIATRRRATRERLQAELDAARAQLEAAKKALDEAVPGDDERQVIQQFPAATPGSLPPAKRSNCTTVTSAEGKQAVRCAAIIPNAAYYERRQALEQRVKEAEDAVADAENAYRRGVD